MWDYSLFSLSLSLSVLFFIFTDIRGFLMLSKHVCMFYSLKNGLTIAINEREKKKHLEGLWLASPYLWSSLWMSFNNRHTRLHTEPPHTQAHTHAHARYTWKECVRERARRTASAFVGFHLCRFQLIFPAHTTPLSYAVCVNVSRKGSAALPLALLSQTQTQGGDALASPSEACARCVHTSSRTITRVTMASQIQHAWSSTHTGLPLCASNPPEASLFAYMQTLSVVIDFAWLLALAMERWLRVMHTDISYGRR